MAEVRSIDLLTNHFPVKIQTSAVFHYDVKVVPDPMGPKVADKIISKAYKSITAHVGPFMYVGQVLFAQKLNKENLTTEVTLRSKRDGDKVYAVSISNTGEVNLADHSTEACHLYNTVISQRVSRALGYKSMGKGYFDPRKPIAYSQFRFDVWPGFSSAINKVAQGFTACVDVAHKIVRMDRVYDVLREIRGNTDRQKDEVVGRVVLTRYNNRTYRVVDIDFEKTPESTFRTKDKSEISFCDYYDKQYKIRIEDRRQPLLVCEEKRGARKVLLIPELCVMTGLTDQMRTNGQLMQNLGRTTRVSATDRLSRAMGFVEEVGRNEAAKKETSAWGLEISPQLIQVRGKQFPPPLVRVADTAEENKDVRPDQRASLETQLREIRRVQTPIPLGKWALIYPRSSKSQAEEFLSQLTVASATFGIKVDQPKHFELKDEGSRDYEEALHDLPQDAFVVCLLPGQGKNNGYQQIKRVCLLEKGLSSQCVLLKTLQPRKGSLLSICSRIIMQINCKQGGPLYHVVPSALGAHAFMVMGVGVENVAQRSKATIVSTVATNNQHYNKYFSQVGFAATSKDVLTTVADCVWNSVHKFHDLNGRAPECILIYREGVSDAQIHRSVADEIAAIEAKLTAELTARQVTVIPPVTAVVVQRRVGTRFMIPKAGKTAENPMPGTVVDTNVTMPPEAKVQDFFLVAQHVNQGCTTPTRYVVVKNGTGMPMPVLQEFTYGQCYQYFNWPGAVRVPAPVQYSSKLAKLVIEHLLSPADKKVTRGPPTQPTVAPRLPPALNQLYFL